MITDYKDLPLGKYLEIDRVLKTDAEEIDKQVQIIAILSDIKPDDLLTMPLTDYAQMAAKTAFLREEPPAVTTPDRVIVNKRAYIPTSDLTKITTAQYVDFQTFSKGGAGELPTLLAALLIPEGAKGYNEGYDMKRVVSDINELPVPVALSLVGFFFARLAASIAASLTSLTALLPKLNKEKRKEMKYAIAKMKEELAGAGLRI